HRIHVTTSGANRGLELGGGVRQASLPAVERAEMIVSGGACRGQRDRLFQVALGARGISLRIERGAGPAQHESLNVVRAPGEKRVEDRASLRELACQRVIQSQVDGDLLVARG